MSTAVRSSGPSTGRAWFRWVTAGEFCGFAAPAAVGAVTHSPPLLVLAGLVEGLVLGWAQTLVLNRVLPLFPAVRWSAATALAAGLSWAVVLGVSVNGERLVRLPAAALVPLATTAGMAVLLPIGCAQWLVLRHRVEHAHRWVWATSAARGLALVVLLAVATPLWRPGQGPLTRVLVGVVAGLPMSATAAAITAVAVGRLVGRPR